MTLWQEIWEDGLKPTLAFIGFGLLGVLPFILASWAIGSLLWPGTKFEDATPIGVILAGVFYGFILDKKSRRA